MFIIAILIPLLPTLEKLDELVLPVQGIACCAVLFSRLNGLEAQANITYIPDLDVLMYIVVLGFITHWLAGRVAGRVGETLDRQLQVSESRYLVFHIVVLVMQSPCILLYSLTLGRQL